MVNGDRELMVNGDRLMDELMVNGDRLMMN